MSLIEIGGSVFSYREGPTAMYGSLEDGFAPGGGTDTSGPLFQGSIMGLAASALSLITNATATALVAYKTWYAVSPTHGC